METRIYTERAFTAIPDERRPRDAPACCQPTRYSRTGRRLPAARIGPSTRAPPSRSRGASPPSRPRMDSRMPCRGAISLQRMPPSDRAGRRGPARCGRPGSGAPRRPSRGFGGIGSLALHRRVLADGADLSNRPDRCAPRSTWPQLRQAARNPITLFTRHEPFWRPSAPRIAISRAVNVVQILESHEHVAGFGAIRRSQDAGQLELIDDSRRATVPDAHAPLQQRSRSQLILNAYLSRLPEQRIALAEIPFPLPSSLFPFFFRFLECRDLFVDRASRRRGDRRGGGVLPIPLHDSLGFVRRDVRALHAHRLPLPGR